jgi:hypothetical protein
LALNIGRAFAYENYLKALVKECLENTEDEFLILLNDNTPMMDTADETVTMALEQIFSVKKLENETEGEFAARMKLVFDADDTIVPVETGIDIPDLPPNAPPSTTNAKKLLEDFDSSLSYQMTWAQYLMDRLRECCDDVAEGYADMIADNTQYQEDTVAWIAAIITDLHFLNAAEGVPELDFATATRAAFDAAKADPANMITDVDSGIVIVDPPANCHQESFDARD